MIEADMHAPDVLEQAESSADVNVPAPGPGAQLALHRQARGWAVEQVADQLNLATRQVQAIEIDNYAALHGMVIARGFIRAYAKLLKIDGTPLVAMMAGETVAPLAAMQMRRELPGSFFESRLPSMGRHGWLSKWRAALALLALILVIALPAQWLGLIPAFPQALSGKIDGALTAFSAAPPDKPVNQVVSVASPLTTAVLALPPVANGSSQVLMAESTPPSEPVAVAPQPVSVASFVASAPALNDSLATGKDTLALKLREDSWIQVRRADHTVLMSRLMKAGSTETLSVTQPVFLTVGNAAGVDVTLRGNPVELKALAKNNVVRLNLK